MPQIETLLPQRYPFLFVDQILSVSAEEIEGIKTYTSDFLFFQEFLPGKKMVPATILLESIVQCGGAGVAHSGVFAKARWGLAGVDKASFFAEVEIGATTKMIIRNNKVTDKVLKQTGTTYSKDRKVLEASWICLRLPDKFSRSE